MDKYVVILAAGKGQSMNSLNPENSKVSYPILGKPMIHYVLDAIKPFKPKEIVLMIYMEGWDHGTTLTPCKIPPGISKFTYSTLDDALQTIYNFEVNNLHHPVVAHNDYDIVFVVKGKNMQECIKVRRDALWAQM